MRILIICILRHTHSLKLAVEEIFDEAEEDCDVCDDCEAEFTADGKRNPYYRSKFIIDGLQRKAYSLKESKGENNFRNIKEQNS